MINAERDELMKKGNSIYKLVVLASRRAYELSQGSGKLVDVPVEMKPCTVALHEILADKISYKERPVKK